MFRQLIAIAFCVCLILPSPSNSTPLSRVQRSMRLCGPNLVEALLLVCQEFGGVYDPQNTRRHAQEEDRIASNHLSPYRGRRQISIRGLADDCCTKACTLQDLMIYCADPQGR